MAQFYKWILIAAFGLATPGVTALYAFWGVTGTAQANAEDVKANKESIEAIKLQLDKVQRDTEAVKCQQKVTAKGVNWIGCKLDPNCVPPPRPVIDTSCDNPAQ